MISFLPFFQIIIKGKVSNIRNLMSFQTENILKSHKKWKQIQLQVYLCNSCYILENKVSQKIRGKILLLYLRYFELHID